MVYLTHQDKEDDSMLTIVISCANSTMLTQTIYDSPRVLTRAVHRARTLMDLAEAEEPIRADIHVGFGSAGPIVATIYPISIEEA